MSAEDMWNSLLERGERPIFRRVSEDHPYDLYVGVDVNETPVLMLLSHHAAEHVPQLKALNLSQNVRQDGRFALLISLSNPELLHPFGQVCEDLIQSLLYYTGTESAAVFLLTRLERWRRLLETSRKGLSHAELLGLLGELLFLEQLINRFGATAAVDSWLGPTGSRQDFQSGGLLYEIKVCGVGAHTIAISSLDQLHTSGAPTMLVVFSIGASAMKPGAFSPNNLVSRVRELVKDSIASSTFELRLAEAGFDEAQSESDSIFIVERERAFEVRDGFPRLTPNSVPSAIVNATYIVDLDGCIGFEIHPSEVLGS